jgi:glycosyltransferase involved in cell wall biosynthesis
MQKQTIVIVINDLGIGGAENLLIGILPELNARYNVVLVTLTDKLGYNEKQIICSKKYILGFTNKLSFVRCVQKLRKIIRTHKPALVHAHLFFSSIIARVACSANIPLVYSIHSPLSKDIFSNRILTFLEKNTVRKKHSVIAVSNEVMIDYEGTIKKSNNSFILSNYISDAFFQQKLIAKDYNSLPGLRMVAVGNIKLTKNYIYLINALRFLKDYPVTLDIYGEEQGDLLGAFQKEIMLHQLPVIFKGSANNVNELLVNYDVYVLPSMFEGFGIAAVEAMVVGLPLLLSNLNVLRSVTMGNALFFDINDPMSLVKLIKEIFNGKYDLNKLSENGIKIAKDNYTKAAHVKKLFAIYDEIMAPGFLTN